MSLSRRLTVDRMTGSVVTRRLTGRRVTVFGHALRPVTLGDHVVLTQIGHPFAVGEGWVTPQQMGMLAARMGAGYVTGLIVGKVLGALTGMPEETQETLRRSGAFVGLVQGVVPQLFQSH